MADTLYAIAGCPICHGLVEDATDPCQCIEDQVRSKEQQQRLVDGLIEIRSAE